MPDPEPVNFRKMAKQAIEDIANSTITELWLNGKHCDALRRLTLELHWIVEEVNHEACNKAFYKLKHMAAELKSLENELARMMCVGMEEQDG